MKECIVCKKEFEQLKNNAHVIPRFLVKQTKNAGRNVYVQPDNIHKKNQSDIVVDDGWCDKCEIIFKEDDDFAKDFFDNKKYLIKDESFFFDELNSVRGIEIHNPACALKFKKFTIGIILRHAIYLKKYEDKNLLGPHFENLRYIYLNSLVNWSNYPVFFIKYNEGISMMGYPTREKMNGINSIFFIILEYRIWIYIDSRHIVDSSFEKIVVNSNNVCALIIPFDKSKLQKDMFDLIEKYSRK